MFSGFGSYIRAWAFFRKEVVEILRQPRLIVTLVLAPFAILALFGAGYQQNTGPLRTMFVSVDQSSFEDLVEPRLADFEYALAYQGVTSDRAEAIRSLRAGRIDVIVVVPDGAEETIRNNERAVFEVLHDQLDPYESATISLITGATVDAVNRSILEGLVADGQIRTEDSSIPEARQAATALREAMEQGNQVAAAQQRDRLSLELASVGEEAATDSIVSSDGNNSSIADLQERTNALEVGNDAGAGDLEAVQQLEADLVELEGAVAEFQSVEPEIIVSPFGATSDLVSAVDLDVTDFYAPGVVTLLLQHLAITFAALSLVKERQLGTTELFRVAPLRSAQMLVGKYLGYMVVAWVVAAALSGLMFAGFGVPLSGSVGAYVTVLTLLVVASLGVGFVISSIVDTDTQAVNSSMIVLLLSIFFSGFFLSIDRLLPEIRVVSWVLPITHALDSLRDVLFRGEGIDLRTMYALGAMSVGLFVVAALLTHRRLAAD